MTEPNTALGHYSYNTLCFNGQFILSDLVDKCHQANCTASKWKYTPLTPGMYGYDNLAICIMHVWNNTQTLDVLKVCTVETIAEMVHEGWCNNYKFWRDDRPWDWELNLDPTTGRRYFKPYNKLGDDTRNTLAETDYDDLPESEKDKDRIIARAILSIAE